MVGPRVANHVLETMHEAYPGPLPALARRCANFADGSDEIVVAEHAPTHASRRSRDAALEAIADEIRAPARGGRRRRRPRTSTPCLLLGAGFPFFLGGITKHLDQTGVSRAGARAAGSPRCGAAAPA